MKKIFFRKKAVASLSLIFVVALLAALLSACSLLTNLLGNSDGTADTTDTTSKTSQSYKITLHVEGFEIEDFIDKGTLTLKKPTKVPEKEGFDFVRWCSDENCTQELLYGTKLSSDLSIYPEWTTKILTVTFIDSVDGSENEITVSYNDTIVLPTKSAAGYDFSGWFTDRAATKKFVSTTKITEDVTLYAGWTAIEYAIHYFSFGGVLSEGYAESYTMFAATTLPTCNKAGYEFVGWYDNESLTGTPCGEIAKGQRGEKSFYAGYICTLAEVRAKSDSVTVTGNEIAFSIRYTQSTIVMSDYLTFSEGATTKVYREAEPDVWEEILTVSVHENEGENEIVYRFALDVVSEKGTTTNRYYVTITQYTRRNITVSYYSNGVLIARDDDREAGGNARTPDDPEPLDGYEFDCWVLGSLDGEEFDFDTILSENISLYAKYNAITYSVVYYLGYGINDDDNPATYTVEDAVILEDAVPTSE